MHLLYFYSWTTARVSAGVSELAKRKLVFLIKNGFFTQSPLKKSVFLSKVVKKNPLFLKKSLKKIYFYAKSPLKKSQRGENAEKKDWKAAYGMEKKSIQKASYHKGV